MNVDVYNPKELLSILVEIEGKLNTAIEKHCPQSDISSNVDFDKFLASFLERRDVKGNEVGFISTQIALQHLRQEIEKTKSIVVDTNDLRAWHHYVNWKNNEQFISLEEKKNKKSVFFFEKHLNYIMLAIALGCIITICYIFFLITPI